MLSALRSAVEAFLCLCDWWEQRRKDRARQQWIANLLSSDEWESFQLQEEFIQHRRRHRLQPSIRQRRMLARMYDDACEICELVQADGRCYVHPQVM